MVLALDACSRRYIDETSFDIRDRKLSKSSGTTVSSEALVEATSNSASRELPGG